MNPSNTHIPLGSIPAGARQTPVGTTPRESLDARALFSNAVSLKKQALSFDNDVFRQNGSPSYSHGAAMLSSQGNNNMGSSIRPSQLFKTPTSSLPSDGLCATQFDSASGRGNLLSSGALTSAPASSSVLNLDKACTDSNPLAQNQQYLKDLDRRVQEGTVFRQDDATNGGMGADAESHDDAGQEDRILSLFFAAGNLGVAFYDECNAELSMGQLPESTSDFLSFRTVLFQYQPTIIITNSKIDPKFQGTLQEVLQTPGDGFAYKLDHCSDREFKYDEAKARLFRLSVDVMGSETSRASKAADPGSFDKSRLLSSIVDLDGIQAVCAAGGLLAYIEGHRLVDELSDNWVAAVTRVKTIRIEDYLAVDPETLYSLQIFSHDVHPSLAGSGRDKEGLSVFNFLDYTKSHGGRSLLRLWFCRPLMCEDIISHRHYAIRFFSDPSLADLVGSVRIQLAQVKNVPRMLLRMRQSTSGVSDWISIDKSLFALASIKEILHQAMNNMNIRAEEIPSVIQRVFSDFCPKILNIARMLQEVINFEESKQARRVVINPGIDDNLDDEKQQYDGLADFLNDIAREEVDELPECVNLKISVIFCPQLGYLLVTPNDGSPDHEQLSRLHTMEMLFNSQAYIYWKTARMRQLDEEIGDIYGRICDQEFNMANQLREKLLGYHGELLETCAVADELDCLLGLSVAAIQNGLTEPCLVSKPVLYIEQGRHPLCEAVVDVFVPNDTSLNAERKEGAIHIITGPNSSGKSIYLKQVAIITFMAHIGSWVPAKASEIGIVDRIFSRVQSRETCSSNNSSFAIDLNQVAVMIRGCTKRSLLLIDEFGKGTQSTDGIALLAATIRELAGREQECPRTVVATHFSELFTVGGVLKSSKLVSFYTMSVISSEDELDQTPEAPSSKKISQLVFLYRLVPGRTTESRGFSCALSAGLSREVVERAKEVSSKIYRNEPIVKLQRTQDTVEEELCRRLVGMLCSLDVGTADIPTFIEEVKALSMPLSGHSALGAVEDEPQPQEDIMSD